MTKYTCIIVDDEVLARELIAAHLSKIPNIEIVAACSNAIDAKFAIEKLQPDILFMDIDMPNLTGVELLRLLKNPPATIITTAHAQYAIEGYALDVVDYLLKPIEFERFFKATTKGMEWLQRGQTSTTPTIPSETQPLDTAEDYIFVKTDYKTVKVVFVDIQYIEALQKYVRIHCGRQRIVTLISMSQLEAMLPSTIFLRIHRSFIVNLTKIDSIDGNIVHIDKHQLPVSKANKEALSIWINKKN